MTTRKLLAGFAALGLAACAPEPAKAPANKIEPANSSEIVVPPVRPAKTKATIAGEEAAGIAVNLAPDELTLVLPGGGARHLGFGTGTATAIEMLSRALGSPVEQATNQDCGVGALGYAAFRDGLSLYFQDGKFAGWDLDGRENGRFTTGNGIGIGTTRGQLEAAGELHVEESTIGHEFMLGEMSGLLDSAGPAGKVTNLWAGVTCIAR